MRRRKLRRLDDGSYGVTLPRDELELLGLVDEDGNLVEPGQGVLIQSDLEGPLWEVRPIDAAPLTQAPATSD